MPSRAVRRTVVAAVTLAVALVASSLGIPAAVAAGPPAPTGLVPDATSVAGLPVLEWNRVTGAARYDVELSTSAAFDKTLWKTSTTNRRATPNVQLPGGSVHWRVRTVRTDGASPWREATFTRDTLAGPVPLAPADGAVLKQPQQPALVSWSPIRGATSYTVQIGTDPQFVDSTLYKTYRTSTSSYVLPDPLVATAYHWRVRADLGSGVATDWSPVRSYSLSGLAKPVLQSPADSPTTSITDVVLDWAPVVGAKTYNLQISTDQNFNTIVHEMAGVKGTRYSPRWNLGNDQYYWRVTPVDSSNNTLDWSNVDTWTFRRHWPDQPELQYPADRATVGDPFYYQWTPVQHASSYRLEISSSPDFVPLADACTTVHTTFTPVDSKDCFPTALGTYYWRVLAYDAPQNRPTIVTDTIAAEVHRFTYDPTHVELSSPAPGESVEVPTLRWQPTAGAAEYKVSLTRISNGRVTSDTTTGTSWTSRAQLVAGETYRWQVQPVSMSGRVGAALLPGSQPTFTVAESTATPGATPEPTSPAGITSTRFPTLSWTPVTDATNYRLYVRRQGAIGWVAVRDGFEYPAGEDSGADWLDPDTYQWRVDAYQGSVFLSGSTTSSTFVVSPVSTATGQGAAMSGNAFTSPQTVCNKSLDPTLPLDQQQCMDLRSTPVLSWEPQEDAGGYVVWISRDQQMTNIVDTFTTDQSIFIPPTALIDSQAGSAFYWWVQPCKRSGSCHGLDYAEHAFNKLSKPVQPLTPAAGSKVANDITFTWRDYLGSNQDATTPGSHNAVYSVEPDVEAYSYRLQVDNDPNFQSPLETVEVDQVTYTSYGNTYPEGPLYWRVQARDGSGNYLTWSEAVPFEKRSPTVALQGPVNDARTSGTEPLRWSPLAYAASYDVEVYANGDTIGQSANLAWTGNSKQVAWASTEPLPVAGPSYTWRVRPRDASNRPGPWTDLSDPGARFRVSGAAPTATSPAPNSLLEGFDLLFTWTGVDGAASYRFERRLVGETRNSELIRTPGLAWAPTSTVGDGDWEWRVVSVDSAGADVGASAWSAFRVDGTGPTVTSYKPGSSVRRKANFIANFSEPVSGVSKRSMKLFIQGRKRPLRAKVSLRNEGRKAVLNPSRKLRRHKVYRVVLKPSIRDAAGNRLTAFSWQVTSR